MKLVRLLIISSLLIFVPLIGCQTKKNAEKNEKNNIEFKGYSSVDSIKLGNNECLQDKVTIKVEANIPTFYLNQSQSQKLYSIFSNVVFGLDSVTLDPQKMVNSMVESYKLRFDGTQVCEDEECEGVDDYGTHKHPLSLNTTLKIYPTFNQNGILTVCKEKIMQYVGETTSKEHQYYNFDLSQMKIIELNDLFSEESIERINELLKNKLMVQNNVSKEDDLIELGYFNLDNLFASNNFLINEKGLTWNFMPLEIGCFNTGETQIFLPYEDLSTLLLPDATILSKYMPKKS